MTSTTSSNSDSGNDDAVPEYTLHEMHLSGNCYKIRLTASLLGLLQKFKLVEYNTLKSETRTEHYLSNINSNGRVPVLQIGSDVFLPESNAACYYLACAPAHDDKSGAGGRRSRRNLIPEGRLEKARMLQWMFWEQYTHEPNVAVLRFWHFFVGLENLTELQRMQIPGKQKQARDALSLMERHLAGEAEGGRREWFVGDCVTLADVSLFAYTHCCDTGGLELEEWPMVKEWVERVRGLEGFVAMED